MKISKTINPIQNKVQYNHIIAHFHYFVFYELMTIHFRKIFKHGLIFFSMNFLFTWERFIIFFLSFFDRLEEIDE